MHYIREVGNMMISNFGRKGHNINVYEQEAYFWRKGSSYSDVLSHMNYEGHGKILTRNPYWIGEMDGISRLIGPEKIVVTVAIVSGKKRSRLVCPEQNIASWMHNLAE